MSRASQQAAMAQLNPAHTRQLSSASNHQQDGLSSNPHSRTHSHSSFYSHPLPLAPNRDLPLGIQFQAFLTHFRRLTLSLFSQISSASTNPLTQASPQQILNHLELSEEYLCKILELQLEHDLNSKKIQNLFLQIDEFKSQQIQSRLNKIYEAEKVLDRICEDGRKDKAEFERINSRMLSRPPGQVPSLALTTNADAGMTNQSGLNFSVALTPTHIMAYARLIAPYTSAPPAPVSGSQEQGINPNTALDLQDPALRFLMPFPTEDIIRHGRMGQEMSAVLTEDSTGLRNGIEMGPVLGETRTADGARPTQPANQMAYPTMHSRRPPPPPPEVEDDVFDLDLNPDL